MGMKTVQISNEELETLKILVVASHHGPNFNDVLALMVAYRDAPTGIMASLKAKGLWYVQSVTQGHITEAGVLALKAGEEPKEDDDWGVYSEEQQKADEQQLATYRREWSAWNWFLGKTDSNPKAHESSRSNALKKRAEAQDMIQTMETLIRIQIEAKEERNSR